MTLVGGRHPAGTNRRSTAPEPVPLSRIRRWRGGRRLFAAVLIAFLAAGLVGWLGVRSSTVAASGGGYDLSLTYASISRPGLITPWRLEITVVFFILLVIPEASASVNCQRCRCSTCCCWS